jgi:hypothetical protein
MAGARTVTRADLFEAPARRTMSGPLRSLILCALVALGACKSTNDSAPQRPPARLTVLYANMFGVNAVDTEPGLAWQARYDRVGTDLRARGFIPDVILLQEMPGWIWCTYDHEKLRDYSALRKFLASVQAGTGVRYRIASHAVWVVKPNVCHFASGNAILYNPQRLHNLMADLPQSTGDGAYQWGEEQPGPHLRMSLPCCHTARGEEGVCALIDGPTQSCSSGGPTVPGAPSWVGGGRDAYIVFGRFELLARPGTEFHVYNVHLTGQKENDRGEYAASQDSLRSLVTTTESRFASPRWIPPIIAGDFNENEDGVLGWLPQFDTRGGPPLDSIVYLLTGKPASFPSQSAITGQQVVQMPLGATAQCKESGVHWSDHCAGLTTLIVQDP